MRTFVKCNKNLKDFLYLLPLKKIFFCLRISIVWIKKIIPDFKYTGVRNTNIRKRII